MLFQPSPLHIQRTVLKVKFIAISHHDRNVSIYQLVPVYQAQSQALYTLEDTQSLTRKRELILGQPTERPSSLCKAPELLWVEP